MVYNLIVYTIISNIPNYIMVGCEELEKNFEGLRSINIYYLIFPYNPQTKRLFI